MKTLPSKPIEIFDAEEVKTLQGKFNYVFFTKNERTSFNGNARNIELNWNLINEGQKEYLENISIQDNLDKIIHEDSEAGSQFIKTIFQDDGIDNKIAWFSSKILEALNTDNSKYSLMDLSKIVNENVSEDITLNQIALALDNPKFLNVNYDENISGLNEIKNIKFDNFLNKKILNSIYSNLFFDTGNPYKDELNNFAIEVKNIEEFAKTEDKPYILSQYDYKRIINKFLGIEKTENKSELVYKLIGYIIEKSELNNGNFINKQNVIIENPSQTTFKDLEIKYSTKYTYRIKPVFYLKFNSKDSNTKENYIVELLFSSKWSNTILINTLETKPPQPPSNLKIKWDYIKKCPLIIWDFPINPQRDIKKFQIFRRENINQPFELIKMFNFDDSEILSEYNEFIDPSLIENTFQTFYHDYSFQIGQKYIYAICAIDAHGFTSNYSMQIESSYDIVMNKLHNKFISYSGAPKQYPNYFLNEQMFVDCIKTQGFEFLDIYFDPEYLKVIDNNNTDLQLLKTNLNDNYKLQFINIDLNKDQIVEIKLNDLRERIN